MTKNKYFPSTKLYGPVLGIQVIYALCLCLCLNLLEQDGNTLAAPDASRANAILLILLPQLVHQMRRDPRTLFNAIKRR